MYQEIERQVALRTGADPQRQFGQQEPPMSQNQAMKADAEAMELSWDHARQSLNGIKQRMNPKYAQREPIVLSNGELLANLIGNESDME